MYEIAICINALCFDHKKSKFYLNNKKIKNLIKGYEGVKKLSMKEKKSIIEDLVVAAYNNAKTKLKTKTNEEISKATGGLGIPGFKWPL